MPRQAPPRAEGARKAFRLDSEGQCIEEKDPAIKADEVLLLVHGTGATAAGEMRWNHPDSPFCRQLLQDVGTPGTVVAVREIRWPGNNLESVRQRAARAVRAHILELEQAAVPYHIIAHSHGGSAVWQALQEALAHRKHLLGPGQTESLPNLRSWTTVGTPFLHYGPRAGWWSLLLVALPLAVSVALAWIVGAAARAVLNPTHFDGFKVYADEGAWNTFQLALLLLASVLLGLAFFRFIAYQPFRVVATALAAGRARKGEKLAWEQVGGKWLGLFSASDEAINGLGNTLHLQGTIIPRWPGGVFLPLRELGNRFLLPVGDDFIWTMLTSRLQGNDTDYKAVSRVLPRPVADVAGWPSLPEHVDAELLGRANHHAATTLTRIRQAFGTALQQGLTGRDLIDSLLSIVNFRELVHTSYFPTESGDYPAVASLIALHVIEHQQAPNPAVRDRLRGGDGADWYAALRDSGAVGQSWPMPAERLPHRLRLRALQAAVTILLLCLGGFFAFRLFHDVRGYSNESLIDQIAEKDSAILTTPTSFYGTGGPVAVAQPVFAFDDTGGLPLAASAAIHGNGTVYFVLGDSPEESLDRYYAPPHVGLAPLRELLLGLVEANRTQKGMEAWKALDTLTRYPVLPSLVEAIKQAEGEGAPSLKALLDDEPVVTALKKGEMGRAGGNDPARGVVLAFGSAPLLALAHAYLLANRPDDARLLLQRHLAALDRPNALFQEGLSPVYKPNFEALSRLYWKVRSVPLLVQAGDKPTAAKIVAEAARLLGLAEEVEAAPDNPARMDRFLTAARSRQTPYRPSGQQMVEIARSPLTVASFFPGPISSAACLWRDLGVTLGARETVRSQVKIRLEQKGLLPERVHLAHALLSLGESDRAAAAVTKALAAADRQNAVRTAPLLLLYLAQKLHQAQQRDRAEKVFDKAVAVMEAGRRQPRFEVVDWRVSGGGSATEDARDNPPNWLLAARVADELGLAGQADAMLLNALGATEEMLKREAALPQPYPQSVFFPLVRLDQVLRHLLRSEQLPAERRKKLLDRALAACQRARSLPFPKLDNFFPARALVDDAERASMASARALAEAPYHYAACRIEGMRALLLAQMKSDEVADQAFEEARSRAEKIGNLYFKCMAQVFLADVMGEAGRKGEARALADKVFDSIEPITSDYERSAARAAAAVVLARLGQYHRAREKSRECLSVDKPQVSAAILTEFAAERYPRRARRRMKIRPWPASPMAFAAASF